MAGILLPLLVLSICRDYCHDYCHDLRGHPRLECASCDTTFNCNPEASDFPLSATAHGDGTDDEGDDAVGAAGGTPTPTPTAPPTVIAATGPCDGDCDDAVDAAADNPTPTTPPIVIARAHPVRCGLLTPVATRDRDALCVHIVHHATHTLGSLQLVNVSHDGTVATRPPTSIPAGGDAWWALRDGVLWTATMGFKTSARIDRFSSVAWYRAACVHEPCASAEVIVRIEVKLSPVNGSPLVASATGPSLLGEHEVSISLSPRVDGGGAGAPAPSDGACALAYTASWMTCKVGAQAVLVDPPTAGVPSPRISLSRALARPSTPFHALLCPSTPFRASQTPAAAHPRAASVRRGTPRRAARHGSCIPRTSTRRWVGGASIRMWTSRSVMRGSHPASTLQHQGSHTARTLQHQGSHPASTLQHQGSHPASTLQHQGSHCAPPPAPECPRTCHTTIRYTLLLWQVGNQGHELGGISSIDLSAVQVHDLPKSREVPQISPTPSFDDLPTPSFAGLRRRSFTFFALR